MLSFIFPHFLCMRRKFTISVSEEMALYLEEQMKKRAAKNIQEVVRQIISEYKLMKEKEERHVPI